MTYPDAGVIDAISRTFAACEIDTKNPDSKATIERYRQAWTPDFRVLGPDGFEYYRWNGYLPPNEFIPQSLLAAGHAWFRMGKNERAAELFTRGLTEYPTSAVAPQAAYWAAVARYKVTRNRDDLNGGWRLIQEGYPNSPERHWQSYIEDQA